MNAVPSSRSPPHLQWSEHNIAENVSNEKTLQLVHAYLACGEVAVPEWNGMQVAGANQYEIHFLPHSFTGQSSLEQPGAVRHSISITRTRVISSIRHAASRDGM